MTSLRLVTTSNPSHSLDRVGMVEVGSSWLGAKAGRSHESAHALLERFIGGAAVEQRSFTLPVDEIFDLRGQEQRAQLFRECGVSLGAQTLSGALREAGNPGLSGLIFTSCTAPLIPSIDVPILCEVGLQPALFRIPLYQQGCAGGAVALAVAHRTLEGARGPAAVAALSVELCSLVFHPGDTDAGSLVGSTIFGDGAACALLETGERGPLVVRGAQSYLVPQSEHIMGYDMRDDGPHLRLSRDLPQILLSHLPTQVESFLASRGVKHEQVRGWLFHPGGSKILRRLEETLNVPPELARWSWRVLREHGNMSSATILFVLAEFLKERAYRPGDFAVVAGVGPGITLELLLFECV